MYICICSAITDRRIVQAAELGARSPEDPAHGLGVGLSCGRCTSCAKALLLETVAKESCGHYVSRDLFRSILASEEDHIDWLEPQLDLIGKIGIANYQQSQGHADA